MGRFKEKTTANTINYNYIECCLSIRNFYIGTHLEYVRAWN